MNRRCLVGLTLVAALCVLVGCQNSLIDRSLIFSTHTTFGLEVSVNPAETNSPAKIIIGYQRTEGVLNPVYYNLRDMAANTAAGGGKDLKVGDFYRPEAYSVLAKFQGGAGGNAGNTAESNMTLSQWFATGEAADLLAKYGGVPALSDNPGVARATAAGRGVNLLDTEGDMPLIVSSIMNQLHSALRGLASGNVPTTPEIKAEANRIVDTLNKSSLVKLVPADFVPYDVESGDQLGDTGCVYLAAGSAAANATGFEKVTAFWSQLDRSVRALGTIDGWIKANRREKVQEKGKGDSISEDTAKALSKELDKQRAMKESWQKMIREDQEIRTMFDLLVGRE